MLKTLPGTIIIDVETLSVPATKISLSYRTWIKKTRPCDILSAFLSDIHLFCYDAMTGLSSHLMPFAIKTYFDVS